MSTTGVKTAFKGGAMVVGGAVGLAFAFPEAVDNWKEAIKNNHVTKASQSLKDTADAILKMTRELREQFDNMRKMLVDVAEQQEQERIEMARRQREQERIEMVRHQREQERIEMARRQREKERIEMARRQREQERIEMARRQREQERIEMARRQQEQERIEMARRQQEQERIEMARRQQEQERIEMARRQQEQERIEMARRQKEQERIEKAEHKKEQERTEKAERQKEQEQQNKQTGSEPQRGNDQGDKERDQEDEESDQEDEESDQEDEESNQEDKESDQEDEERQQVDDLPNITTFEYVARVLQHDTWNEPILFINVYRPSKYLTRAKLRAFLKEFQSLLDHYRNYNNVIVAGDFNIWVDTPEFIPSRFLEFLENNNLVQQVNEPTHKKNHILDLVMSRNVDISGLSVQNDGISDHFTISFKAKPKDQEGKAVKVGLLNCRSVNNKPEMIFDLIERNNLDIFLLTETWSKDNTAFKVFTEASPEGFSFIYKSRKERRGGGVAILIRKELLKQINEMKSKKQDQDESVKRFKENEE
ncbi:apical junction molecule-like [Larimichthys crocea]|uniref:apical junction molecule-like n=1 Tax=Larimichthys crocea TaxID=215358 RepID=UPI000F5EFB84|nr:apical junction molecule-like [Larimichthys crocea]XP_027132030.1 apical junction molecule-like [Larimichthys crocea]